MIEILNVSWTDDTGTHYVPVTEHNAPTIGNISQCVPDGGSLPKIDVYKYKENRYELWAWAATSYQMFQIIEQIMALFNPHLNHSHPYVLKKADRGTGMILEFNCAIEKKQD